jgi:hypothetical protein
VAACGPSPYLASPVAKVPQSKAAVGALRTPVAKPRATLSSARKR